MPDGDDHHPDLPMAYLASLQPEDRAHAALVVSILGPVLGALSAAFPLDSEVVLHDLTRLPGTIAGIANSLTGRGQGGPITDLGLQVLSGDVPDVMANYPSRLPNGTLCRSSSVFFRAPSGRAVVALCFNSPIHEFEAMRNLLTRLLPARVESSPVESFARSVDELAESILEEVMGPMMGTLAEASRADKLRLIAALEARGFFSLKEGVRMASDRLGISKFTLYSYLNEITPAR